MILGAAKLSAAAERLPLPSEKWSASQFLSYMRTYGLTLVALLTPSHGERLCFCGSVRNLDSKR